MRSPPGPRAPVPRCVAASSSCCVQNERWIRPSAKLTLGLDGDRAWAQRLVEDDVGQRIPDVQADGVIPVVVRGRDDRRADTLVALAAVPELRYRIGGRGVLDLLERTRVGPISVSRFRLVNESGNLGSLAPRERLLSGRL